MTTIEEFTEQFIAEQEERLVFKLAALRYCRHSKKQSRLAKDIELTRGILAFLRGETDEL